MADKDEQEYYSLDRYKIIEVYVISANKSALIWQTWLPSMSENWNMN